MCGEMAGDASFTELLVAMGLRSFSMHPAQIAAIKQKVLRADTRRLQAHMRDTLDSDDPQERWTLALQTLGSRRPSVAAFEADF